MGSKEFSAKIFRWLRQINRSSELLATDLKVAVQLVDHFNEDDEGGRAYPGAKCIGDAINMSVRHVLRSIRRMEATGHLRRVGQAGTQVLKPVLDGRKKWRSYASFRRAKSGICGK
jgi:hypothetical protein